MYRVDADFRLRNAAMRNQIGKPLAGKEKALLAGSIQKGSIRLGWQFAQSINNKDFVNFTGGHVCSSAFAFAQGRKMTDQ
jgi:hypothetical protein